jgi:hypothetical protein
MRAVVQRASAAQVRTGGRIIGKIGRGFVVLIGVGKGDSEADVEFMVDRVIGLRVFADSAGKMNLALGTVSGAELYWSSRNSPCMLTPVSGAHRSSRRRRPKKRGGSTNTFSRSLALAVLRSKMASLARRWRSNSSTTVR